MKNPNPVHLQTSEEVREKGWQAESRDADGHLISCHAPIEADDPGIAEWIVECTRNGETVTFWPADASAPTPKHHILASVEPVLIAAVRCETEEDAEFARLYGAATNFEDVARVLSARLRQMDKRAKAANARADRLEVELEPLRDLTGTEIMNAPPQTNEDGTKSCIGEFRRGIETAAASHDQIVTDLRNDPKSYKNGKILRSAKRASDFHERSAAAIRRIAEVRE